MEDGMVVNLEFILMMWYNWCIRNGWSHSICYEFAVKRGEELAAAARKGGDILPDPSTV